jgi:hypothetical protein
MFLLNELSLHGQYETEADFLKSLKTVFECRSVLREYQRTLYCSRATFGERRVIKDKTFRRLVWDLSDKNIRSVIFRWIDKDGPF